MKGTRLLLAALLVLPACSQASALAPVGGNRLSEVRFAAIDVLLTQHVDLLVAPSCTGAGTDAQDISCTGTTVDGQPVAVTAPASAGNRMTVQVGPRTVFTGSYLDVLVTQAQGSG